MTAGTTLRGTANPGPIASPARIEAIDIVRGAVMVLMALDHVRVFSGLPAGGPTAALFFTRWVTHFCAPAFVFLAGTGAMLHGRRLATRAELARYLLTRGALLIVLELTWNRFAWTFNADLAGYNQLNVIWAIGWSMVVLAGLVYLPLAATATFGVVLIAGHNLLDPVLLPLGRAARAGAVSLHPIWQVLYLGGPFRIGPDGPLVFALYAIVPWAAVMAAGYAFGAVMRMETERRRRVCLALGLGATAAFLVLRGFNLYGNPRPWGGAGDRMPAVLSFLNTAKYPASLAFLLMTLGPTIALLPALERVRGRVARWLIVFGRVPLFYYLLHVPVIHLIAIGISAVRTPDATGWLFLNHPLMVPAAPDGYTYGLPLLYAVTAGAVVLLYFPCRWFARLKAGSRKGWLSLL